METYWPYEVNQCVLKFSYWIDTIIVPLSATCVHACTHKHIRPFNFSYTPDMAQVLFTRWPKSHLKPMGGGQSLHLHCIDCPSPGISDEQALSQLLSAPPLWPWHECHHSGWQSMVPDSQIQSVECYKLFSIVHAWGHKGTIWNVKNGVWNPQDKTSTTVPMGQWYNARTPQRLQLGQKLGATLWLLT